MNKQSILLTGGAGFIGSHILDALLEDDRVGQVRVLDNLSTGRKQNMSQSLEDPETTFVEGDIRDKDICAEVMEGIDLVCHQAALGSVPRSVEDPQRTHDVNATGSLNIFRAAQQAGIERIVFASSSAVYGDEESTPKQEDLTGKPLSPYAASKQSNEDYAHVFSELWDMQMVGMRYFNVFGPRQNPEGPYAAVIPKFIGLLLEGNIPVIHGDGQQSRDFTYVDLAVQANLKALFNPLPMPCFLPLNIACGEHTNLNDLYRILCELTNRDIEPDYSDPRPGDIRHSLADIARARKWIDYRADIDLREGLQRTVEYFRAVTSSSS